MNASFSVLIIKVNSQEINEISKQKAMTFVSTLPVSTLRAECARATRWNEALDGRRESSVERECKLKHMTK